MQLWDLTTGKELRTFTGHTGTVWSVAFNLDERLILSGSQGGTVRVWPGPAAWRRNNPHRRQGRAEAGTQAHWIGDRG